MRMRKLAMTLSQLPLHPLKEPTLEQYSTDGEVAAKWLASIDMREPFEEVDGVIDLGAGNGILGIAALLLGAPSAIFVEIDYEVCEVLQLSIQKMGFENRCRIINGDVSDLGDDVIHDVVIMNPPWGRQTPKADRPFLLAANRCARSRIHLLHGRGAAHIDPWAETTGWVSQRWMEVDLPLPASYAHHTRKRGYTEAAMWWLERPAR